MTIPASAQVPGLLQPSQNPAFVDSKTGNLTVTGLSVLDKMYHFINGTSRNIPCNASSVTSLVTLTIAESSLRLVQYSDFDVFQFVMDTTSVGAMTAKVVTSNGTLGTIKVYLTNGSVQANSGDLVSGRQYEFTYVNSLDSGNGGFVAR